MLRKLIRECSFSMPMIKGGIKPHSSKVWRLDTAAANAMRYITLRSVFRPLLTGMTDRIKKWKRRALSTI